MYEFDRNSVNPHYLQNIMDLSKERDVIASEDIYDARGIKLISKGARVDDSKYDRLIRFKLHRPLEQSLSVERAIGKEIIFYEAQALIDKVEPLAGFLGKKGSSGRVLSFLKDIRIDSVSSLLLTMEDGESIGKFQHSLLVSLFSLAFGIELKLNNSMLSDLALAALLHDVGELYINHEYLNARRELTPDEWKHVVVHPHIGQLVIEDMTGYSREVARGIAEHHERANGFGYPRQLTNDRLSPLGRILLVCEALCGILTKEGKGTARACLAVKVIPGEYPSELVSLVASLPVELTGSSGNLPRTGRQMDLDARIRRIMETIDATLRIMEETTSGKKVGPSCVEFLHQAERRLLMLRRAMFDTGVSPSYSAEDLACDESGGVVLEMETVIHEIRWRLRELSRQIALRSLASDQKSRHWLDLAVASLAAG